MCGLEVGDNEVSILDGLLKNSFIWEIVKQHFKVVYAHMITLNNSTNKMNKF